MNFHTNTVFIHFCERSTCVLLRHFQGLQFKISNNYKMETTNCRVTTNWNFHFLAKFIIIDSVEGLTVRINVKLQMLTCIIDNNVTTTLDNSPVSRIFALPVYIWRKSWYSFVSLTCNLCSRNTYSLSRRRKLAHRRGQCSEHQNWPEYPRISPKYSVVVALV